MFRDRWTRFQGLRLYRDPGSPIGGFVEYGSTLSHPLEGLRVWFAQSLPLEGLLPP